MTKLFDGSIQSKKGNLQLKMGEMCIVLTRVGLLFKRLKDFPFFLETAFWAKNT
jgi:hypothetical protein